MSRYLTRTNLTLAAILCVAAFFRLYRLNEIPPGFQFDQAFYVFDALKLLQGEFSIFFYQPGRSEPLYQYLLMPGVALFGSDTSLGLKLTGAAIGTLTVPLIYGITHAMFSSSTLESGREGVRIALLAAFFAAISLWHIFYSRYGERIPLTAFMAILSLWFLWRALTQPSAKDGHKSPQPSTDSSKDDWPSRGTLQVEAQWWRLKRRDYVLTGLFTGLTLYTYPSGRAVPVAIVLLVVFAILTDREHARNYLDGLLHIAVVATIVFLPLGIYYLQHPIDFFSHASEVSIFVPHGEVTGNIPLELGKNALRILGMFFVVGDSGVLRNLPYRPVFDPLVGALFCIGVFLWLASLVSRQFTRLQRLRATFFLVWLGLAIGLSLVSDDAPNNGRILIGFPVVMILPAWGASALWERLRSPLAHRGAAMALSGILVFSALLVYHDYFDVLANDPGTYYAFDTDKVETANWINQTAPLTHLYLAPLTSQNGTISLLTHNARLKSFESRDTIVLPDNAERKDALFAFPFEQEKKVQTMAARLGTLGAREELGGSNGGKLLLIYRVAARNLPDVQHPLDALARGGDFVTPQMTTRVTWSGPFELLGYSIGAADTARRNLEVTLFFHALAQMTEDYTFSVKARDTQDRTWGQEDKWTGDNSYNTSTWSPGDLIIEKFYPGLNACAPSGDYRLTIEAYSPKTGQVLALSSGSNLAELGVTRAEASPSNRLEDLEPAVSLDAQINDRLHLMGYTLSSNEARTGTPFSVSLFWRGVGQGDTEPITIHLQDAAKQDVTLSQGNVNVPVAGRGLCTFYDLAVPSSAQRGAASLWVNNLKFAEITIK